VSDHANARTDLRPGTVSGEHDRTEHLAAREYESVAKGERRVLRTESRGSSRDLRSNRFDANRQCLERLVEGRDRVRSNSIW